MYIVYMVLHDILIIYTEKKIVRLIVLRSITIVRARFLKKLTEENHCRFDTSELLNTVRYTTLLYVQSQRYINVPVFTLGKFG